MSVRNGFTCQRFSVAFGPRDFCLTMRLIDIASTALALIGLSKMQQCMMILPTLIVESIELRIAHECNAYALICAYID
jgi:hypothetical protein